MESSGKQEPEQEQEERSVGRRALLTRGGVVAAGVVGAGVVGAVAAASPASASAGQPVLQNTLNAADPGPPSTEIAATNATAPTFIVTNNGVNTTANPTEAGPSLRLTPSTALVPASATVGGDLVATATGDLWFTHPIPTFGPFAAAVHTDANSNSYVPLAAPDRILDTRSNRTKVLDPTGKFDTAGRLRGGQTIHVDLGSLVIFGEAVYANLTVTGPLSGGFLTVWNGQTTRPTTSSINFAAGWTLANFVVSTIGEFTVGTTTHTDVIGIFALVTTHVILDVAGFVVSNVAQVSGAAAARGSSRALRAREALAQRLQQ